ncbi:rcc01693 family protein [Neorhizobium sp. NPDC001467]|uniref:rcc01693 family protein n=1 Tax=Neorhizobium sp. NPDC001467 TaxID=3390595 RepID=UPI003CFD15FD
MSAAAGEATGVEPFPWDAVIHVGLCRLRLAPSTFWALTPREFFAMAGGLARSVAGKSAGPLLSREQLQGLMTAFPDG